MQPLLKNLKQANEFTEDLYLRVKALQKQFDETVVDIPSEWNIPASYTDALKATIFNETWLNETKTTFLTFLKASLHLK